MKFENYGFVVDVFVVNNNNRSIFKIVVATDNLFYFPGAENGRAALFLK